MTLPAVTLGEQALFALTLSSVLLLALAFVLGMVTSAWLYERRSPPRVILNRRPSDDELHVTPDVEIVEFGGFPRHEKHDAAADAPKATAVPPLH